MRLSSTDLPRRRSLLISAAGLGGLFALWQTASGLGAVDPLFLPSPLQVGGTLFSSLANPSFLADVGISVFRVMTGFVLAAVAAVPLGIYMGTFPVIEALFSPVVGFVRYLPVPAFVPLCILWFGLGEMEKISVIFIGVFFQLTLLAMDEVSRVPTEFVEIGRTCGLSSNENLRRVITPAILPGLFDDLRISVGWAWSYLVVAEIVAASKGLGFLIMEGQRYLRTDQVMAGMLVIGTLGVLVDLTFKVLRSVVFPWARSATG